MSKTVFSIVIPARNGEKFILKAIDSAVGQTRTADEIIVVDDASTDRTAKIAHDYGDRIKYFYNPRATGFVDAWNRAVAKASGEFVTILHQDDLLYPEYLEQMEKAWRKYPKVRHFYSACNYIDDRNCTIKTAPGPNSLDPILYSGKDYAHNYLRGVITNNHIHRCPGVTTSRGLLIDECSYRKEAGHIADDDFFLRVGEYTDVVGISAPLANFRHHKGSETGRLDLLSLELADAYLFQTRHYAQKASILEPDDIENIDRQTVKFINLLLFQALNFKREDWSRRAMELKAGFESTRPGFMDRVLPAWARLMWKLMPDREGHPLPVILYVQILHGMRLLRDFSRSAIHRS